RAVGEPGIDHRVRSIDAPADRPEDVFRRRHHGAAAHRADLPKRSFAFDPHVAASVDDDLVDRRIVEPSLEPTERCAFGNDIDHAARRNDMINDRGSLATRRPESTARATAGSSRVSTTTGAPMARSTSSAESDRPGSWITAIPVGWTPMRRARWIAM